MIDNIYAISPTFTTWNRKWSFQWIYPIFRLYGEDGEFVKEFRSFKAMNEYIIKNGAD